VELVWSLPPVTLKLMRYRKPASLRSLMIALVLALVFALSACEQTGSTASEQSRSTDQPTVGSKGTVRETSQPTSESIRAASEATGESAGNEPMPGDVLTVPSLTWGRAAPLSYSFQMEETS
jgi:hypothetical protein